MRLTPGVFMRGDILGFSKIRGAGVLRRIQITARYCDPVRRADVTMAGMTVGGGRVVARERVNPRARADAGLTRIQAGAVRIGTARAKVCSGSASTGVTAKVTSVSFQCGEGMFKPRLADLLEAVVVVSTTAHSIKILRDNRMIRLGQGKPVEWLIAVVARGRSNSETHPMIYGVVPVLRHFRKFADNNIGPGHQSRCILSCRVQRRHHNRFGFSIDDGLDLDWKLGCANGNF